MHSKGFVPGGTGIKSWPVLYLTLVLLCSSTMALFVRLFVPSIRLLLSFSPQLPFFRHFILFTFYLFFHIYIVFSLSLSFHTLIPSICFAIISILSSIWLSIYFSVDKYKERGSRRCQPHIGVFTGRLSNSTRGFFFPRAHDAQHGKPQAVLFY